jgi:hypothetical protein
VDSQVAYPQAGSFVRYLLDTQGGIGPLRQLFTGATSTDPPASVRARFELIYSRSLAAIEGDWHTFLEDWR